MQHLFNDSSARASFSGAHPRGGAPEDANCMFVTVQLVPSIWVFTETSKNLNLSFQMSHPRGLPMLLSGGSEKEKLVRSSCKGSPQLVGRDTSVCV